MKVLHILYQSYPNISGSSTRTRDILINQKRNGIDPVAITSPFQIGVEKSNGIEYIDQVKFYRTYSGNSNEEINENTKSILIKIRKLLRILTFSSEIEKIVKIENPKILHAHAMFFCAIPAIKIGKKRTIPVVYEIRSLWEERRKDSAPNSIIRKLEYAILRKLETYCMKRATHIVAINDRLKNEIINRGIAPDKITVVGNAVDIDFITHQKGRSNPNLNIEISFGYVGSISPIEGLSYLVSLFRDKFTANKLIIYGTGKESEVKKLIQEINDAPNIHFVGAIKRTEIFRAYNNIDVIVNPRVKLKITESVTPLKPLEAMAFGKIVIASDVGGMKELIQHNLTGFLFKADDISDLENCLKTVMNMSETEREIVRVNASNYILEHKVWESNAKTYHILYQSLI